MVPGEPLERTLRVRIPAELDQELERAGAKRDERALGHDGKSGVVRELLAGWFRKRRKRRPGPIRSPS